METLEIVMKLYRTNLHPLFRTKLGYYRYCADVIIKNHIVPITFRPVTIHTQNNTLLKDDKKIEELLNSFFKDNDFINLKILYKNEYIKCQAYIVDNKNIINLEPNLKSDAAVLRTYLLQSPVKKGE